MQSVLSNSHGPDGSPAQAPYISVVATARNDNHGGNLLGRMQVFVDAWINQSKRHNLSSELILVEWNPPADRPKLAEALRWPSDTSPCEVRIIEVPPELHQRYQFAAALPLYQMIAKNVGIRRARGEFILVTNIDVVFSAELVQFLAQRKLQKGRLYRIDRTDVARDVPVDGTLDEQLAYCNSHVIRLCARDGIFTLTREGLRQHEAKDIVAADSGIWFGSGWYEVELYTVEYFRWIRDEAELFLQVPAGGGILQMEFEAGPGVGAPPHLLQVLDRSGAMVAEWTVTGRTTVRLGVPPSADGGLQLLRLHVPGGGRPVPQDPRIMNFRFFRMDWVRADTLDGELLPLLKTVRAARPTLVRMVEARTRAGLSSFLRIPWTLWRSIRLLRMRGGDIFDSGAEFQIGLGWAELERHGPERYRWVSSEAQLMLRFNDGSASLAMVLEPGPTIGYRPFDLVIRHKNGDVIRKTRVQGLTYVECSLPVKQGQMISVFLAAENSGTGDPVLFPGDARIMNFRVYACGRGTNLQPATLENAGTSDRGAWTARTVGTRPPDVDWVDKLQDRQIEIAEMGFPQFLHLYACGDFQLMARENWADVRGYAELDQFSMHLDSLLSYTAYHMGIQEECLEAPMRVYHLEHDVGSGWTPEGYKQLSAKIAKKGIQTITFHDLAEMVALMRQSHAPMIFNLDNWGMPDCDLKEVLGPPGA
jgi:hypothetical protein